MSERRGAIRFGVFLATILGAVLVMLLVREVERGNAQSAIPLFPGFNEVVWSSESIAVADGLASIDGHYTAVFRWDNADQRWDTFAPQLPAALQGFSQLETDRVYWIRANASMTLVPPDESGVVLDPIAAQTFGDGMFIVDTEIAAGRYRATNFGPFCRWTRFSGFSGEFEDTLAIQFPDGVSAIVDILPTDVGFESSGCGTWTNDLSPVTLSLTAPFGDGTYLVGVDISPGTWRGEGEDCVIYRLAGFSEEQDETIMADMVTGSAIVTIAVTDVGFQTSGCGSWTFLSA